MLRRVLAWIFIPSSGKKTVQDSEQSPRINNSRDESNWNAQHEAHLSYGADEDDDEGSYGFSGAYQEENDWDEYEDEIASAIAFASHQETSADERDWDEEQAEMERWQLEAQESSERWQDWAAVDEIEDDESYQWSEEEEEEF